MLLRDKDGSHWDFLTWPLDYKATLFPDPKETGLGNAPATGWLVHLPKLTQLLGSGGRWETLFGVAGISGI